VASRPHLLAAVAEHGAGRHALGITLGELLAVGLRGGVHLRLKLVLHLDAADHLGHLEAEHECLDEHDGGDRDEDVGGDQLA
jgi:hypothetical protein